MDRTGSGFLTIDVMQSEDARVVYPVGTCLKKIPGTEQRSMWIQIDSGKIISYNEIGFEHQFMHVLTFRISGGRRWIRT